MEGVAVEVSETVPGRPPVGSSEAGRRLTVIVPIHNEVDNIEPFYARARAALDGMSGLNGWQIVFCNNASDDGSLDRVLRLRSADARVSAITLSKNFGYQSAMVAGLSVVESDLYSMIDVDCEDPPELLATFFAKLLEGADLVYGVRSQRDEPRWITKLREVFYVLNRRVADSEIVMWMAEFSMITRQVRDAILAPRTTFPFIRAEMGYVGFTRVGVPYARAKRERGASHFNLLQMTRFAVAGILSSTTFPLRLTLYLASFLAAAYPLVVLVLGLSSDGAARLASIMSLYFLLATVPFLGLYLARTYKNGISRPLFIIDWRRTYLN